MCSRLFSLLPHSGPAYCYPIAVIGINATLASRLDFKTIFATSEHRLLLVVV